MKKILTSLFTLALLYTPVAPANNDFVSGVDKEGADIEKRRGRRIRGGGRRRFRGGGRRRFRGGRHNPYRGFRRGRRFGGRRAYNRYLPYRYIYLNRWVRYNYNCYDGYTYYQGINYYCSNGYLHRYSSYDNCNYFLVDLRTNRIVENFGQYSCNTGYDLCADLRNNMNFQVGENRYFCSEQYSRY